MTNHDHIIEQCAKVGLPHGDVRWMLGLSNSGADRNRLFQCFALSFEAAANGLPIPFALLSNLYGRLTQP